MSKDTGVVPISEWRKLFDRIGFGRNPFRTGNTRTAHKRRIVKTIHSGSPYVKPIAMKTLSAKTRAQMRENHTATITRNSRCPCGSGKRFKRCCFTTPE